MRYPVCGSPDPALRIPIPAGIHVRPLQTTIWTDAQALSSMAADSDRDRRGARPSAQPPPRGLVLENVRLVDGSGGSPIERGRVMIKGDRIADIGPADTVGAPANVERIDLGGRTIVPGLIDLHFHIENDPKLRAPPAQSRRHRVPRPGSMGRQVRRAASHDSGGSSARTAHLHGGSAHRRRASAYPADSVVARDPDEARREAEINVRNGASALKIYFRLPLASAKAVIEVCDAHHIPCTAHLELLDARDLIAAGLHGIEHITSLGTSVCLGGQRKRTGRQCWPTTTPGGTVDTSCSRTPISTGPRRKRSTPCCARASRGSTPRSPSSSVAPIGPRKAPSPRWSP